MNWTEGVISGAWALNMQEKKSRQLKKSGDSLLYKCIICKKEFKDQPIRKRKYCSRICMGQSKYFREKISNSKKGQKTSQGSINHIKNLKYWKGKRLSEEHCKKLSESHKGHIPSNKGIPSNIKPWNYDRKIKIICLECGKLNIFPLYRKGVVKFCNKNCYLRWKSKNAKINTTYRENSFYKSWRREIFWRDNFTCQECGKRGGNIEAHHLKSFTHYSELKIDISNGITLCLDCHKNKHYHLQNKGVSNEKNIISV
jgi:hypothetical protein